MVTDVVWVAESSVSPVRCGERPGFGDAEGIRVYHQCAAPADLPGKLLGRLDRFAVLALQAFLPIRNLLDGADPDRIGVYVGNAFGGWCYGERQLAGLVERGADAIETFLATAWFPAAAQGEVTIFGGLRGCSRTFAGGSLAGLEAFEAASLALSLEHVDVALVGAAESLNAPFSAWGATRANRDVQCGEGAAWILLKRAARGRRVSIRSQSLQPATIADRFDVRSGAVELGSFAALHELCSVMGGGRSGCCTFSDGTRSFEVIVERETSHKEEEACSSSTRSESTPTGSRVFDSAPT